MKELNIGLWLPSEWNTLPPSRLHNTVRDDVDLLLVPESHDRWDNLDRWKTFAEDFNTAIYTGLNHPDGWECGYFFDPASENEHTYVKHSTADRIAFSQEDWTPEKSLPVVELNGYRLGLTICHDQYFSLLMQYQVDQKGADVLCNISARPVKRRKWGEMLQARAIENEAYTFCTMHTTNPDGEIPHSNTGHAFGFQPDGSPVDFTDEVGDGEFHPFDTEADSLYITELSEDTIREESINRIRENTANTLSGDDYLLVEQESSNELLFSYYDESFTVEFQNEKTLEFNDLAVDIHFVSSDDALDPSIYADLLLNRSEADMHVVIVDARDVDAFRRVNKLYPVLRARAVEWCTPNLAVTSGGLDGFHIANTAKDTHRIEEPTLRLSPNRAWGLSSALKPVNHHQEEMKTLVDEIHQ